MLMTGRMRQPAASGLTNQRQDMHDKLFESALGIEAPWFVEAVQFDAAAKTLTIQIDQDRDLPDRRQARLQCDQPSR